MKVNGVEVEQVMLEIDGVEIELDERQLEPVVEAIASGHWALMAAFIDEQGLIHLNRQMLGFERGAFGQLCVLLVEQLQKEQPGLWEWVIVELQARYLDRPLQLKRVSPMRSNLFGSDDA